MSISATIAPHLPFLRRFARALTGTQQSGDKYVVALFESFIADPKAIQSAANPKIALYSGLCKIWSSFGINGIPDRKVDGMEANVQDKLSVLGGGSRLVFLLRALDEFSFEDIGRILGKSPQEVDELYDVANREIANMMSSDVLIIEDEPLIAMDLVDIVKSLGHDPIAVARTHKEALQIAGSGKRPQLILSDIQLADGSSGIDAVNDLLKVFQVPVIFITAFPERLLTGEKPEPAFLITKPFSPEMVKAVISQALFFQGKSGAELGKQKAVQPA
jgi:CheY-like chemotaxis protein